MAEPFSIATGVVGIVAAGVQLSSALYSVCEKIGNAQNSIESVASDLSFFVIVVDELGKIFASPERLYSQELENGVRKVIERCRTLFKEIKCMIGKTKDVANPKLKAKVAWVFRESKVNETRANLESLKSTLGLILHALRLMKEERQGGSEERHVLANLLRSQAHSIKILRALQAEHNGKRQPKTPDDTMEESTLFTAENADILSEVVSPPPEVTNTRASKAKDPTEWKSYPVVLNSDFEDSLGGLLPVWKERVLKNVDFLLRKWAPVNSPKTNGLNNAVPPNRFLPDEDEEFKKEEANIEADKKALDVLRESHKVSLKVVTDRLDKLKDRLRKREIGWLDIEDAALVKLEAEIAELQEKSKTSEAYISSWPMRRQELEERHWHAVAKCRQRAKGQRASKKDSPGFCIPSQEQTNHVQDSLEWLYEDTDSDESEEDPPPASCPRTFTPPPASRPQIFTPPDPPPHLHSQSSPSPFPPPHLHSHSSPPHFPPSPYQFPQSPPPPPWFPGVAVSIPCDREAWKPPQSFLSGSNTFSTVLDHVRHPQLWFTASQDAYFFYLGSLETPFYKINLVPADLSSHETSKVEWTVVQKPWARHKALRAMGFPYLEDSIGFMWIRKSLNWYQVRQIFEFSCGLLDNAINDSSKNILLKRSTSNKKPSPAKKGKTTNTPAVHRCHPPFFHVEDEELQRRMKRSNALEASKPST